MLRTPWSEYIKRMGLNSVNLSEVNTYKELFDIQEKSHIKMENATFSLLDSIPNDVKSLADIGAGPGIVNRYIPHSIQVLAIDLDEDILKKNTCDTLIGDILDIPLENKSVDMAIACDVLEHIEPELLERAVSEMKRISKKYVYLQTPNKEILRYSVAHCPVCGNKWHVNFHKNTFDENKYLDFQDNEWEIIRINYTGNVDNDRDDPKIYKKIEDEGLDIYRVNNFTCPKCGGKSQVTREDLLLDMESLDNAGWRTQAIDPKYSEIGVLYRKKRFISFRKKIRKNKNILIEKRDYHYMDLRRKQRCCPNYSGREQIPFIVCNESEIMMDNNGLFLDEHSFVTFMFPDLDEKSEVKLFCKCEEKTKITIVLLAESKEFSVVERDIQGKESLDFTCAGTDSPIIRVYTEKRVYLENISIINKPARSYYYFMTSDNDRGLYRAYRSNVEYSYLIPKERVAFENEP